MNFKQLEIFVCVAELGSFARAAEHLYMTPSALTQQINSLERSLGCVLLDRTSKGSALTEVGERFLDYAVRILKLQKEAEAVCSTAVDKPKLVRIGTYGEDTSILNERIKQFSGICPDIQISYRYYNYREYFARLENDEIDLFVLPFDNTLAERGLQFIPLMETSICCQMSKSNPLSKKDILEISDLRGHDLIVDSGCQSHCIDDLVAYFEKEEPEIRLHNIKTENEQMDSILLEDHLMITFAGVPTQESLYSYVPLNYPSPTYIGIIARKKTSAPAMQFINFIKSTL